MLLSMYNVGQITRLQQDALAICPRQRKENIIVKKKIGQTKILFTKLMELEEKIV